MDLHLVPSVPSDTAAMRARLDSLRAPPATVPALLPRRAKTARVRVVDQTSVPSVAPRRRFDVLRFATVIVAIVLAVIAAYFSVSGMTRIFPGAEFPVIVMTATMEAGKLAGAAWLSRNWSVMGYGLRAVLTTLVLILACINALGVFGQLSEAHLGPNVARVTSINPRAAETDQRIAAQERTIADLTHRMALSDAAAERSIRDGRITSMMDLVRDQRREHADLAHQRDGADGVLVDLKRERASITGEQQRAAADIGVLEYAASLFGLDREQIMQVLILLMVVCCDPLSITLVVATAHRSWPARSL